MKLKYIFTPFLGSVSPNPLFLGAKYEFKYYIYHVFKGKYLSEETEIARFHRSKYKQLLLGGHPIEECREYKLVPSRINRFRLKVWKIWKIIKE